MNREPYVPEDEPWYDDPRYWGDDEEQLPFGFHLVRPDDEYDYDLLYAEEDEDPFYGDLEPF